jgi:hypothetical protein
VLLPEPERPTIADDFAGANVEADSAQHLRAVGPVAEDHVVEFDVALERRQRRAAARALPTLPLPAGKLGARVEDVAQALHRDAGLLEVGP